MFFFKSLMYPIVGVMTLVAVCGPLLLQPPAFDSMVRVLLQTRDFVHPSPTIWCVVKDFVGRWQANDMLIPYIVHFYVSFLAFAIALVPFLFLKHNHRMFMSYYTLFALTTFIFGYSVHEKHIQYAILMVSLYPQVYKGFITYLQLMSAMMFFPTSCMVGSEQVMWAYAAVYTVFSVIYEFVLVPSDPVYDKYLENNNGKFARIAKLFRNHGASFLIGCALSMIMTMGMYMFARVMDNYKCTFTAMFEDSTVKILFGWLFMFYLYSWVVFFVTYNEGPEEDAAESKKEPIGCGEKAEQVASKQ